MGANSEHEATENTVMSEEGTMVGWREVRAWWLDGGAELVGHDLLRALQQYRQLGVIADVVLADPSEATTPEAFEALCDAGPSRDQIDWSGLPEGLRYALGDDHASWVEVAGSAEEACEEACDAAEETTEGIEQTAYYRVRAREICPWCEGAGRHADGCSQDYDLDCATERRAIEPEEPACSAADEHVWDRPARLVGGLDENPGVRGNGAGVVITEACVLCGCARITDTWGTDDCGEPAEAVRYDAHRYEAEVAEWIDEVRADAEHDGDEAVDTFLREQGLEGASALEIEQACAQHGWDAQARQEYRGLDLHPAHEEAYVEAYQQGVDAAEAAVVEAAEAREAREADAREITHQADPSTGHLVQIVSAARLTAILIRDGESLDRPRDFGPADEWEVEVEVEAEGEVSS